MKKLVKMAMVMVLVLAVGFLAGCSSEKKKINTVLNAYAKEKIDEGFKGGPHQFIGGFENNISAVENVNFDVISKTESLGNTIYFVKGLIKYKIDYQNARPIYMYHYFALKVVKDGFGEMKIYPDIKEYLALAGDSGLDPYLVEQAKQYIK